MTVKEEKINKYLIEEAMKEGKKALADFNPEAERRFNAYYAAIDKYLLSEKEEEELEVLYDKFSFYKKDEILMEAIVIAFQN